MLSLPHCASLADLREIRIRAGNRLLLLAFLPPPWTARKGDLELQALHLVRRFGDDVLLSLIHI